MKQIFILYIVFGLFSSTAKAQFAPQVGQLGSLGIFSDSSIFVNWATNCTVKNGWINIEEPSLGFASAGDSTNAIGPADDISVSLGDSGIATLTFNHFIIDGPGPDFAVFENGFLNPTDSNQAFLELGFVEVSSDGVNFFRFPATSLTPTNVQVGTFDYLDARKINNLAGKYIARYGTPFDLNELAGKAELDIHHVTHVRIIDVIGSTTSHVSYDSSGNIINDPFFTPFPSCGFDLDAVGVINEDKTGVSMLPRNNDFPVICYPNPIKDVLQIKSREIANLPITVSLNNSYGILLKTKVINNKNDAIFMDKYPEGIYFLNITDNKNQHWVEKIIKY